MITLTILEPTEACGRPCARRDAKQRPADHLFLPPLIQLETACRKPPGGLRRPCSRRTLTAASCLTSTAKLYKAAVERFSSPIWLMETVAGYRARTRSFTCAMVFSPVTGRALAYVPPHLRPVHQYHRTFRIGRVRRHNIGAAERPSTSTRE